MNILFFITHKTLGENHADMVFQSISKQKTEKKFDELVIYNSHSHELSNDSIISLFDKHGLNRVVEKISIFDYDQTTSKTLGGDISAIRKFCKKNYKPNDRVLILKSDCCLSCNYFDVILNIEPARQIHFVAPFICAKKRVDDSEILKYLSRESFIRTDEITFFVEDSRQSTDNDFYKRQGSVLDNEILFTSCTVTRDFTCHFISVSLMDLIIVREQSWGGCGFTNLDPYILQTDRCFVVHKYHDVESSNRIGDREGPVREWLNS